MVSENKANSDINQGSAESTATWKDPSLPIANLKLSSTEVAAWGAIAAALALKVAEGAAARLGEKMIDYLFDGSKNYVSLNRSAIAAIHDVIKQSISEEALAQCNIKLQATQQLMQTYQNAPESNFETLRDARDQMPAIIIDLQRFEVLGIGSFTIAATLYLAMLLEYAFRSGDSRNLITVKQRANEYIEYAKLMQTRFIGLSPLQKVTPCLCVKEDPNPAIVPTPEGSSSEKDPIVERPPDPATRCRYFDGEDVRLFINLSYDQASVDCQKSYENRIQDLKKQLDEQTSAVQAVISNWQKIVSSL